MQKFSFLLGALCLLLLSCSINQSTTGRTTSPRTSDRPPGEPGKCYAKVLMPDQYSSTKEDHIIFTGNPDLEKVDLKKVTVEIRPHSTKWVKKKTDRNCVSKDPKDCLVWCLVEVPGETVELTTVVDTTQTKNWEVQTIEKNIVETKGGYTEWKEVVCQNNITPGFLHKIYQSLAARGFDSGEFSGTMDTKMKASLSAFQRENRLPVGQLDKETLTMLDVKM